MFSESENLTPTEEVSVEEKKDSKALQVIGWFSIGMAVAALGIYLGVELRSRSKFKKRTPYDFYANAGEQQASEFGVGVLKNPPPRPDHRRCRQFGGIFCFMREFVLRALHALGHLLPGLNGKVDGCNRSWISFWSWTS